MAISTIKKLQTPKWTLLAGVKSSDLVGDGYNTVTLSESIEHFSLLRINTSYYTNGISDYGGETISVSELKAIPSSEILLVSSFHTNLPFTFAVKYVNDTTVSVKLFNGTSANNKCLSIHGIL